MLQCLACIRLWNRLWRRSSEHKAPHWADDSLDIIEHLNLLPTALAILLVPRHFFRKTKQILRGASPHIYKTPVKFLYSAVPFFIGLHYMPIGRVYKFVIGLLCEKITPFFFSGGIPDCWNTINAMSDARLVLPILALTPLWIPIFSIVVYVLLLIPAAWHFVSSETLNKFLVPVDPHTYWRLHWRLFFWNLFYFAVYFLVTFPLAVFALYAPFHGQTNWFLRLPPIRLSMAAYPGILIVWPYVEMLRGSLAFPTRLFRKLQLKPLRRSLEKLRNFVNLGAKMQTEQDYKALRYHLTDIETHCDRLRLDFTEENATHLHNEKWSDVLIRERRESFATISTEALHRLATWKLDEPMRQSTETSMEFIASCKRQSLADPHISAHPEDTPVNA
jgi:hypothetical protein